MMTSVVGSTLTGSFPWRLSAINWPAFRVREALIPSTAPEFLANATRTAFPAASPSPVQPSTPTTSAASETARGKFFRMSICLLPWTPSPPDTPCEKAES
jgi:hypothetical protein